MASVGRWVLAVILASGMGMSAAWARTDPAARPDRDRVDELMIRHNLHPAFQKLGRGAANAFLGFTEIPLTIHKQYTPTNTGESFMTGVAQGIFRGVVRTGVGLYEVVTFFLPYPEDYAPVLPPLEYFKRSPIRDQLPLD